MNISKFSEFLMMSCKVPCKQLATPTTQKNSDTKIKKTPKIQIVVGVANRVNGTLIIFRLQMKKNSANIRFYFGLKCVIFFSRMAIPPIVAPNISPRYPLPHIADIGGKYWGNY